MGILYRYVIVWINYYCFSYGCAIVSIVHLVSGEVQEIGVRKQTESN